jgi:hypothetical protein
MGDDDIGRIVHAPDGAGERAAAPAFVDGGVAVNVHHQRQRELLIVDAGNGGGGGSAGLGDGERVGLRSAGGEGEDGGGDVLCFHGF